jgi:tripartite ATP-independent transporter DctM subunit
MGIWNPETVSVGDLFLVELIPGLGLVVLYMLYLFQLAVLRPDLVPPMPATDAVHGFTYWLQLAGALIPPLGLIVAVLGSILGGFATPTEAASVGGVGAILLALLRRKLDLPTLKDVMRTTTQVTSMVFTILIGASIFSLVFRGYGGDEWITGMLTDLPGGVVSAVGLVMLVMFLLGFILDFIEITFVIVPIVGPVLLAMGVDPVWLGIMIALNLQTSFLTPPFGFALFYLRGVAPSSVKTGQIYRGVMPFILIQLMMLGALAAMPELATWLPDRVFNN